MEKSLETRPPRSFVRRMWLPLLGISSVLSATGWCAYELGWVDMLAVEALQESEAETTEITAKDELKNLFAAQAHRAEPAETSNPFDHKPVEEKTSTTASRYSYAAPSTVDELPPLPPAKPSAAITAAAVPASPVVGSRYATSVVPEVEPEPAQSPVAETLPTDVTRGQDSGENPLRAAFDDAPTSGPESDYESDDDEARAAFSNQMSAGQPRQPTAVVAEPTTAQPDPMAAALHSARPLNPTSEPTGRYSAPPVSSMPEPSATINPQAPASPYAMEPDDQSAASFFGASQPPVTQQPVVHQPAEQSTLPTAEFDAMALSTATTTPGISSLPGTGRPGERLLEGLQSPTVTVQKLAPEEIQVGKRCVFAVRVKNTGQRTAHNVQIHDEVPRGMELVGSAPRATVSGSHVVWELGTLSVGEERTVEMELVPREEGELGSVATVVFAAQASAKSRCTKPELALRLSSQPIVLAGEQHIVQIEISNPGSGAATGIMLLETVPEGVTHEAGPALEFEVGSLQPGESKRLDLVLTADSAGQITNTMIARADANLQVEASCEFEVIAPELRLTVAGPQKRFLERPATYQLSVENPGTAPATDVQLVTYLPKGMQFVSANNLGEYDAAAHSVHWSLAELPPNERGTVEVVALPIEAGNQKLTADTKSGQGLADHTEKQIAVEGLAAVTFEVTQQEGLIEVGGENTYEIHVSNQGSKEAVNVQVVAQLPTGMRPVAAEGETRHTIQGASVVFAPMPQLAPKADATFRVRAQSLRDGDQRIMVQVAAADMTQPITKEVSTRVYSDQ
jgi:uncharacterized repeat protein (TIGR01451 family)